jgi:hypothetical protein
MTSVDAQNTRLFQESCGMCPDLYSSFATAESWRDRRRASGREGRTFGAAAAVDVHGEVLLIARSAACSTAASPT